MPAWGPGGDSAISWPFPCVCQDFLPFPEVKPWNSSAQLNDGAQIAAVSMAK